MKQIGATTYLQDQVMDRDLCTYCGACLNLCPYYTSHNNRIIVLDSCARTEGRCLDFCPRLPTDMMALKNQLFKMRDITPEIGAVKAFYITRAANMFVRKKAQHGGTVTALMDLALKSGLIEAAVLSGGDDPWLPTGVMVNEVGQTGRFSKSRFVATPTVAVFNQLNYGEAKSIGIVATPCQALALAKMRLSPNSRINGNIQKLRLVIGLFCGWALSSEPLKDLLTVKVDPKSVIGMDIPPSQYHCLEVQTTAGTIRVSLDEVQKCIRPSCRTCSDMSAEWSDISVGSARLPGGWDEARSWNQVLVRTEKGQELMDLARSQGVLEFREVPEGNLERLKAASLNKKKTGEVNSRTFEKERY